MSGKGILVFVLVGAVGWFGWKSVSQYQSLGSLGVFGFQYVSAHRLGQAEAERRTAEHKAVQCAQRNERLRGDLADVRNEIADLIAARALDSRRAEDTRLEREREQLTRERERDIERRVRAEITAGEDCVAWATGLICVDMEQSLRASRKRLIEEFQP